MIEEPIITDEILDALDIPKKEGKYLDAFNNPISFNGNIGLKSIGTQLNLNDYHIKEIKKCKESLEYFTFNYAKIPSKGLIKRPELREYQAQFLEILNSEISDIICLMPRQSGKTTSVCIYIVWQFIFNKNLNIGLVANRLEQAKKILQDIKRIFINLPIWLTPSIDIWNVTKIHSENNNAILCDVPNSDSFRGFTINILLVDEAAFIKTTDWQEFADSVMPTQSALPFYKNIIISTANGQNHFYHLFKNADLIRTKNQKFESLKDLELGPKAFEVSFEEVPRFNKDGSVMDPEIFKKNTIRKYGQVYFEQNFGNNFFGSSKTLVMAEALTRIKNSCKEPLYLLDNIIKIFEEPLDSDTFFYIIGVDSSKNQGDFTAISAIKILISKQVKIQEVASAKVKMNYMDLPYIVQEIGNFYNNAVIVIENNEGSGQSLADFIFQDNYDNLYFQENKPYPGFRTTKLSRKQGLEFLKSLIEHNILEIQNIETYEELSTFIEYNGKFQAQSGYHDDLIMSLVIAISPLITKTRTLNTLLDSVLEFKNCYNFEKSNNSDILVYF